MEIYVDANDILLDDVVLFDQVMFPAGMSINRIVHPKVAPGVTVLDVLHTMNIPVYERQS
jgi:hypothetical protein